MAELKTFYFNELRECTYVIWDESGECAIIDPGCSSQNEFGRLEKFIVENGLKPVKLLLTHGHFDHVMGVGPVSERWNLPVHLHPSDREEIGRAPKLCSMFGLSISPINAQMIDIEDGQTISFGETVLKVLYTPGHTQGGVCYLDEKERRLFSGDTLFAGSIGRTDHPGGDYDQLIRSIFTKLLPLDGETNVFPGHGPATDIGYERCCNPFLQQD